MAHKWRAHDTRLSSILGSTLISTPSSSTGGVISKTCKMQAIVTKADSNAKNLPGHILCRDRQSSLSSSDHHGQMTVRTVCRNRTRSPQDHGRSDLAYRRGCTFLDGTPRGLHTYLGRSYMPWPRSSISGIRCKRPRYTCHLPDIRHGHSS